MQSTLLLFKSLRSSRHLGLFFLVLAWLCCILIAFPRGEFPMNDDWSFNLTAKEFIERGTFKPLDWTGMPLTSQVVWGAIFSFPGGFSFESLRISTIALAALGIVVTYMLCQEASGSRMLATLGASVLAFNPIYFALSNQFMTDVPFTVMTAGSAYCLSLNLGQLSSRYYILGLILSAASTLNRQLGIVVPAGYAISMMLAFFVTRKKGVHPIFWILPLLISTTSLLGLEFWMRSLDILPALYHKQNGGLLRVLASPLALRNFVYNSFMGFAYIGLFVMPILMVTAPLSSTSPKFFGNRIARSRLVAGVALILGLFVFGFVHLNRKMPLAGNILYLGGIGPISMVNGDPRPIGVLSLVWSFFTILSALGGSIIICYSLYQLLEIIRSVSRRGADADWANSESLIGLFYFICIVLYLTPVFIHGFFDRYLVPCLPLILGWLLASISSRDLEIRGQVVFGRAFSLSAFLVGVFMAYSILGTRDLFVLNRVRWGILDQLTKVELVSPRNIDGGFEFNGLYLYDNDYKRVDGKSWWWVEDDDYILSLSRVDGYVIDKSVPFRRLLPPQESSMLLLKRSENISK